jgi:hypothetical protein
MLDLVWSEMPRRSSRGHTYNTGAPQSRDALVAFTRVALVGFGGPVTHRRILHTAWGEQGKIEGRVLALASRSPVNQKIRRIIVADVMVHLAAG